MNVRRSRCLALAAALVARLALDLLAREDDTVVGLLEPLDGVVARQAVGEANLAAAVLALGDAGARAAEDDEEVHAVNAGRRVVLEAEVNVLLDAKAKVAARAEVAVEELKLLDGEGLLEDLLGLGAADGDKGRDLLVTADAERADGQAGLGEARLLIGQLLEHLGGAGQAITRLAHADVDNQLVNVDVAHHGRLLLSHGECVCVCGWEG
eukprot:524907_1